MLRVHNSDLSIFWHSSPEVLQLIFFDEKHFYRLNTSLFTFHRLFPDTSTKTIACGIDPRHLCPAIKNRFYENICTFKGNLLRRFQKYWQFYGQELFQGLCVVQFLNVGGGRIRVFIPFVHGFRFRLAIGS